MERKMSAARRRPRAPAAMDEKGNLDHEAE
jgi:hypothetical protein